MDDILAGVYDGKINVNSRSRDLRARMLSPLFNRPFELDGQMFSSFEGFFNGIKFPEDDPRRRRAFASSYGYAQRFGTEAQNDWVWWGGKRIASGSSEHLVLIERAHRASIFQNEDLKDALRGTAGLTIVHETGDVPKPNAPYPAKRFCAELMQFREELLA